MAEKENTAEVINQADITPEKVHEMLKKYFKDTGISYTKACEKTKIRKDKLSNFINGNGSLWPNELIALMKFCNWKIIDHMGKEV